MIADLVCSNKDNDAQGTTNPNYHGKVNRMLCLFLVQANNDAFSEVVFKLLAKPPFWRLFGVGIVASIYYFDRMSSHVSLGIKYLKVSRYIAIYSLLS